MKYSASAHTSDYLSFPAVLGSKPLRSVWTAAPTQAATTATEQVEEAQVARGLMVAVPLSFVLWVPLIWAAIHFL